MVQPPISSAHNIMHDIMSQQFNMMSSSPFNMMPGSSVNMMPGSSVNMMPGQGMVMMSIQMDTSPIDNIMSSLIGSLINPQMSRINMPQISSSKNYLYIDYE